MTRNRSNDNNVNIDCSDIISRNIGPPISTTRQQQIEGNYKIETNDNIS